MRYFGEDPIDKSARAGFFRRFADFMNQYQIAKKENMGREESRKKEQARKKVLGTATKGPSSPGGRDARTLEANNKIMDDLLDKLRGAPKDSTRHQRRRAARRNVSGGLRSSPQREIPSPSRRAEALADRSSPTPDSPTKLPSVAVTAATNGDDGEEVDLGKVAQGLLAGLKGGDDLLASWREARKSVNEGMKTEEVKTEDGDTPDTKEDNSISPIEQSKE